MREKPIGQSLAQFPCGFPLPHSWWCKRGLPSYTLFPSVRPNHVPPQFYSGGLAPLVVFRRSQHPDVAFLCRYPRDVKVARPVWGSCCQQWFPAVRPALRMWIPIHERTSWISCFPNWCPNRFDWLPCFFFLCLCPAEPVVQRWQETWEVLSVRPDHLQLPLQVQMQLVCLAKRRSSVRSRSERFRSDATRWFASSRPAWFEWEMVGPGLDGGQNAGPNPFCGLFSNACFNVFPILEFERKGQRKEDSEGGDRSGRRTPETCELIEKLTRAGKRIEPGGAPPHKPACEYSHGRGKFARGDLPGRGMTWQGGVSSPSGSDSVVPHYSGGGGCASRL